MNSFRTEIRYPEESFKIIGAAKKVIRCLIREVVEKE